MAAAAAVAEANAAVARKQRRGKSRRRLAAWPLECYASGALHQGFVLVENRAAIWILPGIFRGSATCFGEVTANKLRATILIVTC